MTAHITSPSFPNGLEGLRSEGEARAAYATLGMSDDQAADEARAMEEIFCAMRIMRKAIRLVNHTSVVTKISLQAWDDFVHDEMPSEAGWKERIAEARS